MRPAIRLLDLGKTQSFRVAPEILSVLAERSWRSQNDSGDSDDSDDSDDLWMRVLSGEVSGIADARSLTIVK